MKTCFALSPPFSFHQTDGNKLSRQVLLFSATLPPWVHKTAKQYMRTDKLEQVDLVQGEDQKASTDVRHIAIPCHWSSMASTISDCLAVYGSSKARTIVFCETKKECNEMLVNPAIKLECQALHGDIPQVCHALIYRCAAVKVLL